MRITESQQRILESLCCERLSSNEDNFQLVDDFYNGRNPSIVQTLQNEAFEDDLQHRIAYYVVKDANGHILFYFSLKCGLLYDEFLEGDRLLDMKAFYEHIFQLSKDPSLNGTDKEAIEALLEKARTKKGLKKWKLRGLFVFLLILLRFLKFLVIIIKMLERRLREWRLYTSVSMMLIVQYGIELEYNKN